MINKGFIPNMIWYIPFYQKFLLSFLDVCLYLTYQKIKNDVGDQHIECKKEDDSSIPVSTISLPVICIFEPRALLI